ncbi:unnamed protein product, partial [Staurois parvus]
MGPLCPCPNSKKPMKKRNSSVLHKALTSTLQNIFKQFGVEELKCPIQGRTDNSWGPRAIGDHGAPVSLPKLKKAYEKGTRGISWGPLLTPGPRAVPKFPNGQSAP